MLLVLVLVLVLLVLHPWRQIVIVASTRATMGHYRVHHHTANTHSEHVLHTLSSWLHHVAGEIAATIQAAARTGTVHTVHATPTAHTSTRTTHGNT